MDAYLDNIAVEAIGPWEAEQKLGKSTREEFNSVKVAEYAEAMRHGKWGYPGGTIEINVDGNLKDGHHRLAAVKAAGVVLPMIVVYNVPR